MEDFQQYLLDTLEPDAKQKAKKKQEKYHRFQGLACTLIEGRVCWVLLNY
jgi:hypothetical protein